jgi:hypothetical protein
MDRVDLQLELRPRQRILEKAVPEVMAQAAVGALRLVALVLAD